MSITAQREAELLAKVPTGLLINGEWRDASDGGTFDVLDPATGQKLLTLASATSEDAMAALDAADAVQAEWALTAPRERAEILRRAFDLVTERKDDFALLMSLEMGGVFNKIKGLVVGGMTNMGKEADNQHYTESFDPFANQLIMERVQSYHFPVVFQFPNGHIEHNLPLIIGMKMRLIVGSKESSIQMES